MTTTTTAPPENYGYTYGDGETVAQVGHQVMVTLKNGLYASGEITGLTENGLAGVSLIARGGRIFLFPVAELEKLEE